MKSLSLSSLFTLVLLSCGGPTGQEALEAEKRSSIVGPFTPVSYTELELDPGNDSLWYHLVLDIPGDLDFAIAQPTEETNRFGIRFQLLDNKADGTFECKGESSPAYDSAKLFPTFFKNQAGQHIILADTGEKVSWGQKVYLLDNGTFYDLGFIDMGTVDYATNLESDSLELSPQSIAPRLKIEDSKKGLEFRVDGETMVLYDNGKGKLNQVVSCNKWHYLLNKKGNWSLKKG